MLHRFEQFCASVSGLYRCIQQIERDEMEKYGLKGAHAQYLVALHGRTDGMTAAQLAFACDRDKAAVSRSVAEMEAKGLLRREAAGDSAYRARLRLTEAGRAAARYVCEKAQAAVEIAGRGISDEERAVLYAALAKIAANLQKLSETGMDSARPAQNG